MSLPTYGYVRQDRDSDIKHLDVKEKGRGLLIFYKQHLSPYVRVLPEFNLVNKHIEQLWVKIEKPGWKHLYIADIYRPPSGVIEDFINHFKTALQKAIDIGVNCPDLIVLGDFNINYSKTRSPERKALKNLADDFGLKQIINTPTRITNKCQSTIDLIFTNINPIQIRNSGVMDHVISDHLPIYINIKRPKPKHIVSRTIIRTYKHYTYENFKNILLDDNNWRQYWAPGTSIDRKWQIMLDIINNSINKLCPLKTILCREDQHPWVDEELRNAITKKRKLYKEAVNKVPDDQRWQLFKDQRAFVRKPLVSKKRDYITQTLEANKKTTLKTSGKRLVQFYTLEKEYRLTQIQ